MGAFTMPSLGADMTEGTLVEWLVEEGTEVHRGDLVAEVETGKGIIVIEVYEDGVLEDFRVEPGTTVAVGTVLAEIRADEGHAPPETIPQSESQQQPTTPDMVPGFTTMSTTSHPSVDMQKQAHPPQPAAASQSSRPKISPLARSRAQEWGIDPASIQGTGPEGAVTLADIEQARKGRKTAAGPDTTTTRADKEATPARPAMRRAIARATSLSNREIPHYFVKTSINMLPTLTRLEEHNKNHPITERLLPIVPMLKAVALAAHKIPDINGFYRNDRIELSAEIHLGFAISLRGGGLVAPCIHDVAEKSMDQIMRDLHDLITRTRAGRLRESELRDATMTVTSLGDLGVETVYGVIYPPQLALIGFGRISERPWAENGMLTVRPVVDATLAGDHRATDGRTGARFLETLNTLLQQPENL